MSFVFGPTGPLAMPLKIHLLAFRSTYISSLVIAHINRPSGNIVIKDGSCTMIYVRTSSLLCTDQCDIGFQCVV